jgi:cyclopropane-fatty-acyl-phospholipid synthase
VFWEKKLETWVDGIRGECALPLRLKLWNGQQFDFDKHPPQVTVRVPDASSLSYLLKPSLANLGQAYVEGKIEVEGRANEIIRIGNALAAHTLKPQRKPRHAARGLRHDRKVDAAAIQYHYDVSNDFYRTWLDENMVYSCAYFENGDEDLATAQLKKLDHILTKIQVRPGDRLLDIGCGWGALVIRAAQKYGANCVGITLSKNQHELAQARVEAAGVSHQVEIRLQDYRDIVGTYDRITSVGMFEHVGIKHLPDYFAKIHSLLTDDGLAMNHGITTTDIDNGEASYGGGEFIGKYVFPHGELPHIGVALKAMQTGKLEALDVENLRHHYARTCALWADNFETHAEQIKKLVDSKRFRIWRVYLAGCAYAFAHDWVSIYQVICGKAGRDRPLLPWSRRYIYDSSGFSVRGSSN